MDGRMIMTVILIIANVVLFGIIGVVQMRQRGMT